MKKVRKPTSAALLLLLLGGCAGLQNREITTIDHEWWRVAGAGSSVIDGETIVAMHERPDGARFVFGCTGATPVVGAYLTGMSIGRAGETRTVEIIIDDKRIRQTWQDHQNVAMTWGADATGIMTKLALAKEVVVTSDGHTETFTPNFAGAVRAMAKECPDTWNRT